MIQICEMIRNSGFRGDPRLSEYSEFEKQNSTVEEKDSLNSHFKTLFEVRTAGD